MIIKFSTKMLLFFIVVNFPLWYLKFIKSLK